MISSLRKSFAVLALAGIALSANAQTVSEEQLLRAIAQSFRSCSEVSHLDRNGSQFRMILYGSARTEFDLGDMEIANDWSDKVSLSCHAPGCISQYLASGGKWHFATASNSLSLSCPGAGNRITAQLAYFFDQRETEEQSEQTKPKSNDDDWTVIGSVDSQFGPSLVELKSSSIRNDANPSGPQDHWQRYSKMRSAWIRITFAPVQVEARKESMSSALMHLSVSCDTSTARTDSMIAFSGSRGEGEKLASTSDRDNSLWVKIATDTVQDIAQSVLCAS